MGFVSILSLLTLLLVNPALPTRFRFSEWLPWFGPKAKHGPNTCLREARILGLPPGLEWNYDYFHENCNATLKYSTVLNLDLTCVWNEPKLKNRIGVIDFTLLLKVNGTNTTLGYVKADQTKQYTVLTGTVTLDERHNNGEIICTRLKAVDSDIMPFEEFRRIVNLKYVPPPKPNKFPCGYDYLSEAGAWFKMHTLRTNWLEAKQNCLSEDAQLASPINKAIEKAMVLQLLNSNEKYEETYSSIHIESSSKAHLIRHLNLRGSPGYALSDKRVVQIINQDTILPYVCYKLAPEILEETECGYGDHGYLYDGHTNHCYKFHHEPAGWLEANSTCESEGGYLAIINNAEEAKEVQDTFVQTQANNISEAHSNQAFPGIQTNDNSFKSWKTVQGKKTLNEGYKVWSSMHPVSHEDCVAVGSDGILMYQRCDNLLPYICEKDKLDYSCDLPEDNDPVPYYCTDL